MPKNIKPKIIAFLILILFTAGAVRYVQYLMNEPLNIEIPKHFTYNGTKIALAWTDDNTGENLIIQSDKKEYNGFSSVDVYFSITNITRRNQEVDIKFIGDHIKLNHINHINPCKKRAGIDMINMIESGETNFYKAALGFAPMSNGKFFIEAIGNKGGYGYLDPWYSSNWTYRKHIIIDADQVATTTSAFPVLATTTDADLIFTGNGGKVASSTGADIVFADNAGDILNYEREYYDSATGEIAYWIKTDISSTTDTILYMYYGNSTMPADLATTTGVWDDNYVMVNHLAHDGVATTTYPDFLDSTKYNNDGSSKNMNSDDLVDGQIDGSLDFDGSEDRITGGGSGIGTIGTGNYTVSMWVYKKDTAAAGTLAFDLYNPTWAIDIDGHIYAFDISSKLDSTGTININEWQMISYVRYGTGADELSYFIEGESAGTATHSDSIGAVTTFNIATDRTGGSTYDFNGLIDEVRISNVARTAGWIETEYNNQVSVGDFMTFGAEECNIPTITSVTDSPDPAQHSSTITFSVDWNDINAGETIKVKICKTDSLTGQNCGGGHYASSTAFTADDPAEATYAVQADDIGTKNYYAFVCDDDGNCSESAPGSFTIRVTQINSPYTDSGNWYNANWKYKRAIVLNNSQISTTTNNFPILATTTLSDLKSYAYDGHVASNDGHDIIFVDDDNATLLNFEREYYDPATGEIAYWIKTDISSTTDKTIYMYYGSSASSDQATTTGVWDDTGAVGIWHLSEGSGDTAYDSSGNGNDCAIGNDVTWENEGLYCSGATDNSIKKVDSGYEVGKWDQFSIGVSMRCDIALALDNVYLWHIGDGGIGSNDVIQLRHQKFINAPTFSYYTNFTGVAHQTLSINTDNDGLFHDFFIVSENPSLHKVYVDGVLIDTFTSTITKANWGAGFDDIYINIHDENHDTFYKHFSLYNTALTAQDISTQYNNQSDVGSFMTFGAEESLNRVVIVNAPITNYLTDGLVGHWTFNGQDMDWSAADAEAIDRSGQGNHGNVVGAKAVIGKVGQGLEFDGVGDYVDVANTLIPNITVYSVSLWAQSDGTPNAVNMPVGYNGGHSWYLSHTQSNDKWHYCWRPEDSTQYSIYSDSVVTEGKWYYIIITNNGSNQYLYIDGVQQLDSKSQTGFNDTTFSTEIGRGGNNSAYAFDGLIDEVRIYNRALSADEVGELYRVGSRKMKF